VNLKSRVKAHLRNGSINKPGADAVEVLADQMKCKDKSAVKNVLAELLAEGTLDLGGGSVHYTSYIGMKRTDFRPHTQEGRRQSNFAVDQLGNHYCGTAIGGPLITRQATLEEWVRMGNNPSEYKFGTPANEIKVQEATPMDENVPKPEDTSSDEAPADAAVPVTDEHAKPKRQMAPRVDTAPQRQKLDNIKKLKELIAEEAASSESGLIPSAVFKALAAERLSIGEASITSYVSSLVKDGFVEYVKTELRGMTYIRLVTKLDAEAKVNAVLELLRTLKRKRSDRLPLKEEIAALLKTTPGVAEVGFMQPLRKLGMYKTEAVKGSGLWKFKLVYVQDGPVTEQQMADIRELRKTKKKEANDQVDTETAPEATTEVKLIDAQPEVVFTDAPEDEITTLISGLVDANDAYKVRVQELEAALAHLQDVNSSYVRMIQELDEKVVTQEVMLEAERAIANARITPAKPALPEELLQRARAIVTKKDPSSTIG